MGRSPGWSGGAGFVPSWSKDLRSSYTMINAQAGGCDAMVSAQLFVEPVERALFGELASHRLAVVAGPFALGEPE